MAMHPPNNRPFLTNVLAEDWRDRDTRIHREMAMFRAMVDEFRIAANGKMTDAKAEAIGEASLLACRRSMSTAVAFHKIMPDDNESVDAENAHDHELTIRTRQAFQLWHVCPSLCRLAASSCV